MFGVVGDVGDVEFVGVVGELGTIGLVVPLFCFFGTVSCAAVNTLLSKAALLIVLLVWFLATA